MSETGVSKLSNRDKALALAKLGMHVFPLRHRAETIVVDGKEVVYKEKTPLTKDGFHDAVQDPKQIKAWWGKNPDALVGVNCGASGINVLDIDVERDDDGVIVKDGFESLMDMLDDVPETYTYTTFSGEGEHRVYLAPEGIRLGPATNYRKMGGIDRRAGGSYVAWAGDVPESRDEFAPAPAWLCDVKAEHDLSKYTGTVSDWFEGLEPGNPSLPVRNAIERAEKVFREQGSDLSHSDVVERQHEAVRLGAEGHPGVRVLLDRLKELTLERTGSHSRTPDEYEYEFMEALRSGISKYGDTIDLRKRLPEYSVDLIPATVPDRMVTGEPGDKYAFNELLASLIEAGADDDTATAILWGCSRTRDLARDWGLEFVFKRVVEARQKPNPVKENPALERNAPRELGPSDLLSQDQIDLVLEHPTFVDDYLEASATKGFGNVHYDVPAAWTLLSMAFGFRAFIPKGVNMGLNMWFITLGESGTGKTSSDEFLRPCLDFLLKHEGETYFNLGAGSSPEAMGEALLERDRKPSIIHHDEASDFFENVRKKDWMSSVKDLMAKWYMGYVDPIRKKNLNAELRGKSALTSFNLSMMATPSRLLSMVSVDMWESGFLARVNWGWAPPNPDSDAKYKVSRSSMDKEGTNPAVYDVVSSLLMARRWLPAHPVALDWTAEAELVLSSTHKRMDEIAKGRDHYEATEPAVTRLGRDTIWKAAGLLALWRGETVIREIDALTAVYYAQGWFDTMFRVVDAAGEGDFNQDLNKIEKYLGSKPHGVTEEVLFDHFRGMVQRSSKELDDRINFLLKTARVVIEPRDDGRRVYRVNGVDK